MITIKSIFASQNLLPNPKNPLSDPPEFWYCGEVNSGTWFKIVKEKERTQLNHILMSFCCINRLTVGDYGKLTIDALLTCCL